VFAYELVDFVLGEVVPSSDPLGIGDVAGDEVAPVELEDAV
jgi:hypothetical protein